MRNRPSVKLSIAFAAIASVPLLLWRFSSEQWWKYPVGPVGMCPEALPLVNPYQRDGGGGGGRDKRCAPLTPHAIEIETERFGAVVAEPCQCYSESYREARHRFLSAAERAGAEVTSIEVVSKAGEAYYMDLAVMRGNTKHASSSNSMEQGDGGGGDVGSSGDDDVYDDVGSGTSDGEGVDAVPTEHLVVHSSGVHGVEGYAGSAIQIAALRHLSSTHDDKSSSYGEEHDDDESTDRRRGKSLRATPPCPLSPSTTLVFVHAVNPFGMAHFRRTNENNVDLNRNALDESGWDEVLSRDKNVAGYDDFDTALFNVPRSPSTLDATILFWIKAVAVIVRKGYVNMKRSLVAAQYHNARGIFYGGRELQPSHRKLISFLKSGGFFNRSGGKVTWIDVHTGLGPSGVDTLLVRGGGGKEEAGADDDPRSIFRGAPRPILGGFKTNDGKGEASDDDDNDDVVSSGYNLTRGVMEDLYPTLFVASPTRPMPMMVTQEFGTVSGVSVARALVLENMAYHYSSPAEHARWARLTRDAFYVRTDEWRRNVLRRGLVVLFQALSRSSE